MKPFAFATPIAIPELGADAGDWIEYHPEDPELVYIIKEVPKRRAAEAFNRLRILNASLPSIGGVPDVARPHGLRRLK